MPTRVTLRLTNPLGEVESMQPRRQETKPRAPYKSKADFEKYGYVAVNGTDLLIEGKILYSDDFPAVDVGTNYASVTGFLSYSYGQYRIQPRSVTDFVE